MHTSLRLLFLLAGVGILGLSGCGRESNSASTGGAKPSGATTDQQRDLGKKGQAPGRGADTISADELTEEFARDHEATNKKYRADYKVREVEGIVDHVIEQIPSVCLKGVKNMSIECMFYPKDSPEAAKARGLKKGQKVKIKGKYATYFPDSHLIRFDPCDSVEILDEAKSKPSGDSKGANPTKAEPSDYKKLEGEWKVIDSQTAGKTFMDGRKPWAEGSTFTFETGLASGRHKVTIYVGSLKSTFGEDFRVDPEKSPKVMDIGTTPDSVWKNVAIYKLDGDTLTICAHSKERPKDFTTKPKDERTLYILKKGSATSK